MKGKIKRSVTQKELIYALLAAQEKQRTEIWLQIQENIRRILLAAKLFIDLGKTDEINQTKYLDMASDYISELIQEIGKMSKCLTSSSKNGLQELIKSINSAIKEFNAICPISIEFITKGLEECQLLERMQLDIFIIVQEQLSNIVRFSKASWARVGLTREGNVICLDIYDNGVGCDPNAVQAGDGSIEIGSRVESNSGRLEIISKPGEGYRLKVTMPLPADDT